MSDQATPSAGWYADPERPGAGRYWDGTAWTEHRHVPGAQQAPVLRAPEGTDPNTPWIWVFVLLPLLGYLPLFLIPWSSAFSYDPRNPESMVDAQLSILTSPGYLGSILLSFLLYAALVVVAYLDHRELLRRQVPKPFHWAFAFIPSYGILVYPIGRAVVMKGRTGGGLGPIWVMIGVFVIGIVVTVAWTVQFMSSVMSTISTLR